MLPQGPQVAEGHVEEGPPAVLAELPAEVQEGQGRPLAPGDDRPRGEDRRLVDVGTVAEGRLEGLAHPAGLAVVELVGAQPGPGVPDLVVAGDQVRRPGQGPLLALEAEELRRRVDQVAAGVDEGEGRLVDDRQRPGEELRLLPDPRPVPRPVVAVAVEEQGGPVPDVALPEGLDEAARGLRVDPVEIVVEGVDALQLVVPRQGGVLVEGVGGVAAPVEQAALVGDRRQGVPDPAPGGVPEAALAECVEPHEDPQEVLLAGQVRQDAALPALGLPRRQVDVVGQHRGRTAAVAVGAELQDRGGVAGGGLDQALGVWCRHLFSPPSPAGAAALRGARRRACSAGRRAGSRRRPRGSGRDGTSGPPARR